MFHRGHPLASLARPAKTGREHEDLRKGIHHQMMNLKTKLFARAVGVDPDRGRPGWIWKAQVHYWLSEWRLRSPWLTTVFEGCNGIFSDFWDFWEKVHGDRRQHRRDTL